MKHTTFKVVDSLRRHVRGEATSHISVVADIPESTIRDWIKKVDKVGGTAGPYV